MANNFSKCVQNIQIPYPEMGNICSEEEFDQKVLTIAVQKGYAIRDCYFENPIRALSPTYISENYPLVQQALKVEESRLRDISKNSCYVRNFKLDKVKEAIHQSFFGGASPHQKENDEILMGGILFFLTAMITFGYVI